MGLNKEEIENLFMYKYLIVDSVWFGAVFARETKRLRKSVLVMERREHVSGNVYRRRSLLPRQQRAQPEPLKQCAALVKDALGCVEEIN